MPQPRGADTLDHSIGRTDRLTMFSTSMMEEGIVRRMCPARTAGRNDMELVADVLLARHRFL
jgi:hypothetical protein